MDKSYFIEITIKLYHLTSSFPEQEPLRKKMRKLADEILSNLVLILKQEPKKEIAELKKLTLLNEKNLEVLDSYFEVARVQDWTSSFDIWELQKKYSHIKKELEKLLKVISENETLSGLQTGSPRLNHFDLGVEGDILGIPVKKEKSLETVALSENEELGAQSLQKAEVSKQESKKEVEWMKQETDINYLKEITQNGSLNHILTRQIKILQILKKNQKAQTQEFQKNGLKVSKRTIRRDLGFLIKQGLIERIGEKNKIFYQLNNR